MVFVCVVDETRVTLNPLEGYEHDYINASFIKVSGCDIFDVSSMDIFYIHIHT